MIEWLCYCIRISFIICYGGFELYFVVFKINIFLIKRLGFLVIVECGIGDVICNVVLLWILFCFFLFGSILLLFKEFEFSFS